MNEIKNKGIYPILASACFIVYAIVFFASSRRDLYNIIWLFIYFSYGVLFFVRKKNMGFVIVACISILIRLYMFALYFNIATFMIAVTWSVWFILIFINVTPSIKKSVKLTRTKVLSIIPGGLYLVYFIYMNVRYADIEVLIHTSEMLILVAGFIFGGLWLGENVIPKTENEGVETNSTGLNQESNFDGVDIIIKYKELLESGIITQEEFEEKKKQVLGL